MSGTDAAIEALGDVISAYRKRIAELEQLVLQQQAQIDALKQPMPEENAPQQ